MKKLLSLLSIGLVGLLTLAPIPIPSEQDQIALFENFKGLNTKVSDQNLPPQFAVRAENLRFTPIGSLKKRFSFAKYNGTSLGTDPIYFIQLLPIKTASICVTELIAVRGGQGLGILKRWEWRFLRREHRRPRV